MRFAFIAHHRSLWPVVLMCEVLGVSKAGFYRWRKRPPSPRQQANESLQAFLLHEAEAQMGIPGYRKLWEAAVAVGYACSKNRVQRLLQRAGYRSCCALKPGYRRPDAGLPVLPNLLNRAFDVSEPNRVWVSDITQLRCEEGWLYQVIIMDLYGRRVIGKASGAQNTADLVLQALKQAWKASRPVGKRLLFHSDQGCQYRSEEVMGWLTRRGVTLSMSRIGNCWDNACAESFFARMKQEWTRRLGIISRQEMAAEIDYYIDDYYNTVRRHGTLGGKAPSNYVLAA